MITLSHAAQVVLAGMISLMPPGKSVFSRTSIPFCDEICQKTPTCSDPSVLCEPPRFSQEIYESKIDLSLKDKLSTDEWNSYDQTIRFSSYTKAESYQEGLERYATIAEAITEVSSETNWNQASEACQNKCSKFIYLDDSSCKKCLEEHPWLGSEKELRAALSVVFFEESGYRQDVHSGLGALGKGDCKWRDKTTQKPAAPFAKNASPIPGTCRSFCLGQINIGSDTKYGLKAQDLIGTDLESTKRCAKVSTHLLAQARRRCSHPLSDLRSIDPILGMFAAYGTGGTCRPMVGTGAGLVAAAWPSKRAVEFRQLLKTPRDLDDSVKTLLGIALKSEMSLN